MQPVSRFRRYSNDRMARLVVYLSPYFFWAVLSFTCAGLWLFLG